jgi:hypothetical protein
MRYMKMKRVIALFVLLAMVVVAGFGYADNFPSQEEIASAEKTGQQAAGESARQAAHRCCRWHTSKPRRAIVSRY